MYGTIRERERERGRSTSSLTPLQASRPRVEFPSTALLFVHRSRVFCSHHPMGRWSKIPGGSRYLVGRVSFQAQSNACRKLLCSNPLSLSSSSQLCFLPCSANAPRHLRGSLHLRVGKPWFLADSAPSFRVLNPTSSNQDRRTSREPVGPCRRQGKPDRLLVRSEP